MVSGFDTHFQRGFLMGMEAIATHDTIMAPPWYREPKNAEALSQFNHGVVVAFEVYRVTH